MTYALLLVAIVIWGWTFIASKVCLELLAGVFVAQQREVLQ